MGRPISILTINPWITDFAAYNLWAEPVGLLFIASILKEAGVDIHYVDCTYSIDEKNPLPKRDGRSKYLRRIAKKPEMLSFVPRYYANYGITEDEFCKRVCRLPKPDAILITSVMTYWYPGVFKAIKLLRKIFSNRIPFILGGIYAQLCHGHAVKHSGADFVINDVSFPAFFKLIEQITGKRFQKHVLIREFSDYPPPLHELHANRGFFSVLTGTGCPFRCSYCASGLLSKGFSRRTPISVFTEIHRYTELLKTRNIAFYDDALLHEAHTHIIPILETISERGISTSFHLPNGIHACFMTKRIASLLRHAGAETIRIGLETADRDLQSRTGMKTTNWEYQRTVDLLRTSGYDRKKIGTYIMVGFPGQTPRDVERSITFVHGSGASPFLSYFSPLPNTPVWKEAVQASPFPIEREPLFQNNTVFILGNPNFSAETLEYLKAKTIELRNSL